MSEILARGAATPDVAECKDCCDTDPCATTRKWKTTLKLPTAKAGAYGICYCDGPTSGPSTDTARNVRPVFSASIATCSIL